MPKFEHLGSKYLKTNFRFEISTFEIVNRQIIVKIRNLILFDRKCPNSGIWAQNFQKTILNFKEDFQNRVQTKLHLQIRKLILLCPKTHIWAFGVEFWKTKAGRKFQIFSILKLARFGSFRCFLGGFSWFWLVLACSWF